HPVLALVLRSFAWIPFESQLIVHYTSIISTSRQDVYTPRDRRTQKSLPCARHGRLNEKRERRGESGLGGRLLADRRLDHLARADADRAGADALRAAVDEGADVLQVGHETAARLVVGVRVAVARDGSLAAEFTALRHRSILTVERFRGDRVTPKRGPPETMILPQERPPGKSGPAGAPFSPVAAGARLIPYRPPRRPPWALGSSSDSSPSSSSGRSPSTT